jgi:hypothetical protein
MWLSAITLTLHGLGVEAQHVVKAAKQLRSSI